ncbi:MAG TPA: hypothetical protein VK616_08970 [Flavitalea sp.]|nr:hypothetical protein [Flavitalea sp.]
MIKNEDAIDICLQLIEQKLNWGESRNWSSYDFGKLSDIIQDKTGVMLSVTTLKRLWGKLKYDNLPSITTLNTLARFLDFKDWREFSQRPTPASLDVDDANATTNTSINDSSNNSANTSASSSSPNNVLQTGKITRPGKSGSIRKYLLLLIPGCIIIAAIYTLTGMSGKTAVNPDQFEFSANKIIGEGVPNSVIFSYDASAAKSDSVYIVQTWDISRKTLVPRDRTKHSAIYYYPGFFRTKLIVDGTVVKSHVLQITSNGWLCLAEQQPEPVYFRKDQYIKEDRIEVDSNALKAFNLSLHPKPPKIRFFNQSDMGALMNDNFVFETTLKNEFHEGAGACQNVQVLIQCKDDIIVIPLAAKACVGDIRLYAAGKEAISKHADLSKFGCDLKQWTTLKVETINRHMIFYVNDVKAYELDFPNPPTGIVGVQYRFNGLGAVKDTRFTAGGKLYKL